MDGIFVRCGTDSNREDSSQYIYSRNNPYDRSAPIQYVVPELIESKVYMRSIREFQVPPNAFAVWFLGQNGFILKDPSGLLIGLDLYLTNSCACSPDQNPYRCDRQLPVFIEPEDLDVDVFITTHSHADHADPETIRRVKKDGTLRFVGPFDSMRIYKQCEVEESRCQLIHPGESLELGSSVVLKATFALPTDDTDLNHTGMLIHFSNGLSFYDTGDTAYAERLSALLPTDIDVCAICINGGYHNLAVPEATAIVRQIRPRVVVPCHYDMMVHNIGSPHMLRTALDIAGASTHFAQMTYYEPWLYQRG